MAVMVSFTLKGLDTDTYKAVHPQMLEVAVPAGLLFHSAREVDGGLAILDFWPNEESFRGFSEGPLAGAMQANGIAPPDDVRITPVLNVSGP